MRFRRLFVFFGSMLLLAAPLMAQPGQSEFVPVNELPRAEQMPAAPLVIAAYAFVWVAVLVYLFSIWRRIGKVEADLHALERRTSERAR